MPETTFSFNQKVDHTSITAALNKNNGYDFGDTLKKETDMNVERMLLYKLTDEPGKLLSEIFYAFFYQECSVAINYYILYVALILRSCCF